MSSRRGRPHAMADCLTCGERCPSRNDSPDVQRAWARRHAWANPGHTVHVTTETVRVYEVPTSGGSDRG